MPSAASPHTAAQNLLGLVAALLVSYAAAAVGAVASARAPELYAALSRPDWAPPANVFGPVWTVLYALMAVAAWLVWRRRGLRAARAALALFAAQLALNALWSWLFFSWRLGAAATAEVLLLWALIAATMVAFARIDRFAAVLLLPYLGWVGFASALTFSLWRRNPHLLG